MEATRGEMKGDMRDNEGNERGDGCDRKGDSGDRR